VLSSYHDDELIKYHFNHGAKAYVSKHESPKTLINAIKEVYLGKTYKDNIPQLLKIKVKKNRHYYRLLFSELELKIITLLCDGKTTSEIANTLNLTEGYILNRLSKMHKKVGVNSRTKFIIFCVKEGLYFLG